MIGKILHNGCFGATTRYVTRRGAILLGGNMLGRTATELTHEFGMLQALRPDLPKPVVHMILSFAPNDSPTDAKMLEIATEYLVGNGYEDSLHTIWRHLDGTTDHAHIVTGQMDIDGKAISQSFERFRNKRLCRELEIKYGLQTVTNIRMEEAQPPNPPSPFPEADGLDIELPSVTTVVSDFLSREIRAVLPSCTSVGDLAQALQLRGITMVPQVHVENGQVYGLGYRIEAGPLGGSFITGSKVPGNFSPTKLVAKHGLTFDPVRDLPIIRNPRPIPIPTPKPIPTPSAPSPIHLKPPKPRRKKKRERNHARNQRNSSKLKPILTGPCPWVSNGTFNEIIDPDGIASAGTKLVRKILGDPHNRTPAYVPPSEPLFPGYSTNSWGMARHH